MAAATTTFRNNALDARNFFNTSTPALKQNIFGGSLGGPVYHPGTLQHQQVKDFLLHQRGVPYSPRWCGCPGLVPDPGNAGGDFSQDPYFISQNEAPALALDPSSQALLASEHPGVNCLPTPTSINPACFDSNSVALMNHFLSLPNITQGNPFLNYLDSGVETVDQQDYTERIDHRFNDKYTLLARVSYETNLDSLPYLSWGSNPAPTETNAFKETGFNNMLQFTANINPTTINQITFTQTDDKVRATITGAFRSNITPPLTINLPYGLGADITNRAPDVKFANGWSGEDDGASTNSGMPENASDQENILADDFTKVKGGHTLQAGVMLVWGIKRQDGFAVTEGEYAFSGVHSGDSIADFLLGLDTSFSQNSTRLAGSFRYTQQEGYIQDDWKVNRKLTINMGVRVVYYAPETMDGNGISDFDPSRFNPAEVPVVLPNGNLLTNAAYQPLTATGALANTLNGIVVPEGYKPNTRFPLAVATPGVPNGIFTTSPHFGPRLGFAYDPSGQGEDGHPRRIWCWLRANPLCQFEPGSG